MRTKSPQILQQILNEKLYVTAFSFVHDRAVFYPP